MTPAQVTRMTPVRPRLIRSPAVAVSWPQSVLLHPYPKLRPHEPHTMNNRSPDESQDTQAASACLSAIAQETMRGAIPVAEPGLDQEPAAEAEPVTGREAGSSLERGRAAVARVLVVVGVGIATFVLALSGTSWILYRAGHTVISNAAARGRVHRVGARIDGQVKSVEVQPNQRVSKGDVLIHLEADHLQAALREAQSDFEAAS